MGPQGHGAAGVRQRIPCNAGLFMVGAAEPAVNNDQTAPALDGALAALLPHRHMTVDDVAGAGQTEFRQDAAAGGLFIVPCINRGSLTSSWVAGSAIYSRSKVVMALRPNNGDSLPHHRYHKKS